MREVEHATEIIREALVDLVAATAKESVEETVRILFGDEKFRKMDPGSDQAAGSGDQEGEGRGPVCVGVGGEAQERQRPNGQAGEAGEDAQEDGEEEVWRWPPVERGPFLNSRVKALEMDVNGLKMKVSHYQDWNHAQLEELAGQIAELRLKS